MSPLGIKIMIHYHYSAMDWSEKSPAADDELQAFVALGMLEHRNGSHEKRFALTPCGQAYVDFLMRVPVPKRKQMWSVEIDNCHIEMV